MQLRFLQLRDWKAFETARFDFPAATADRNVILIGGQNGFGKTSLFEAIVLGLFGKDGLRLVLRAGAAADEERRAQSYKEFLRRALNARGLAQGRTECRVTLGFLNEAGEPVEIRRVWHFSSAGDFRDEEVTIHKGIARTPLAPDPSDPEPDVWYRDWLAREFLHPDLAGFFLFDGEAAAIFAEREMSVQVRQGIEGLLGLSWLRRLADSLRGYAANRRTQIARGATSDQLAALDAEIARMDADMEGARARLAEVEAGLPALESERDALMRELASHGAGTAADNEEWIARREAAKERYREAEEALASLSEQQLPLALAGAPLREAVLARLEAERRREEWLAGAASVRERAEGVLETISADLGALAPPLSPAQQAAIAEAIRHALERLWHPAPQDAAESFRHAHLDRRLREEVRRRLEEAARVTAERVQRLQGALVEAAAAVQESNERIEKARLGGPALREKIARIEALQTEVTRREVEKSELRNRIASLEGELHQKRAELGRLTALLDQSELPARRARRAEEVAQMLDALTAEALPLQSREIAAAMSAGISAMAHKKDLFRGVEIDAQGEVRLIGPDGRDLRELDLSAGEKQVFTQALFAAVAEVSGRVFPLVVDTPLGRLDEEHRLNVLRHLAARQGQVFLISTNTEVVGPYLEAIRPRVAKAYRLENRVVGEGGVSWPEEGYFPGQGL
ncbi:DNA sulfur modification protein DndD [Rubritepida flocculans]|uniref:DNA sulfur modification protein DndD n=1 Tax=Rubritepida flocculans TaxID=182403 RepID=UPI00042302A9|nr:DNA sulfur modification protein DndD [Rubritepida flocculans]